MGDGIFMNGERSLTLALNEASLQKGGRGSLVHVKRDTYRLRIGSFRQ